MGSFGQWFNSRDKKHPARVTWVCGSSPVLREEVVDWILNRTSGTVTTVRAEHGVPAVWEALSARGIGAYTSTIVVRQAELIARESPGWRDLPGFLDALRIGRFHDRYVIFVADQPDTWQRDGNGRLVTEPAGGPANRDRKIPWPHVARFQKSAMCDVVVCSTLSGDPPRNKYGTPTRESDAVLWVQSLGPIGIKEAEYLIRKTDGDLYTIKNVMGKAAVFDRAPTIGVIDVLLGQQSHAGGTFTEYLVAGDKASALVVGAASNLARELKALDKALDALGVLHSARRNHQSRSQALRGDEALSARERVRVSAWDVDRFWEHAMVYDPRRRATCRRVLGEIERELAGRAYPPPGLLEALVAKW